MDAGDGENAKESRGFDWRIDIHLAEVHWYEAAGIGRKEFKIKGLL